MRRLLAALGVLGGLSGGAAEAREGAGTIDDPIRIDALPYARKGTTAGAASDAIDSYACADTTAEAGPEVVFRVEVPEPGRLRAWLSGDGGGVDVDVHLLSSLARTGTRATMCLARGNTEAEADVAAGSYFVVVDTFGAGTVGAGAFVLRVDLATAGWTERPLADGVTWKVRYFADVGGEKQTQNALVIDPAAPGVRLVPVQGNGCERPSAMGKRTGALAAWNAGFFDTATARCDSVSLLKVGGRLVAPNATGRSAFGLDAMGRPLVDRIAAGVDWPAATDAIGGVPRVVRAGMPSVETTAEGISSASFIGPNPRTAMGIDAAGRVAVLTADGRTEGASGLSLMGLAMALLDPGVAAVDALNYDGGGSTGLWIAGTTASGVVSYPSDNGQFDHAGERAVGSAWTLHAPPFDQPPRFSTVPPTAARVGAVFTYDADAVDLDVDDVLTFSLEGAPSGMTVDADGVVTWAIPAGAPAAASATLVVSDGRKSARQALRLAIEGGGAGGGVAGGGVAGGGVAGGGVAGGGGAGGGVAGGGGAGGGVAGDGGAGAAGGAAGALGAGAAGGGVAGARAPPGGCATGPAPIGGAGLALACALVALRRRR